MKKVYEAIKIAIDKYGDYPEAWAAITIIVNAIENYENSKPIRKHRGE